jgi:hypothetical protein
MTKKVDNENDDRIIEAAFQIVHSSRSSDNTTLEDVRAIFESKRDLCVAMVHESARQVDHLRSVGAIPDNPEIDRLRAAIPQWQPIEGARNLIGPFLCWDNYYGVRIGRVLVRADHDDWLSYYEGHGNTSKGGLRATHFMPLPPQPEGK